MKYLFILLLFTLTIHSVRAQILKADEDLNEEEFTFESLDELDGRMAIQLAERKLKTMITGVTNASLAAVPFVGTGGVQQELLGTNMKFDELITLNKNYNYKLTAALGNILKVIKNAKDGTLADRAESILLKGKVIKQSVDLVSKIEKLKKSYERLSDNGWKNSDIIRSISQLDILMKKAEELTQTLINAWNATDHQQRKQRLEETREKLKDLDNYVTNEISEMDYIVKKMYTQKLNDELSRSYFDGIYNYKLSPDEAKLELESTISESHNNLIAFRNVYWIVVAIIAFIAAIGYVFRFYTENDNMISANIIYWMLTLAITAFLGVLLELVKV